MFQNNILEPPKSILSKAESAADGGPLGIAKKTEVCGEEEVVDIFRSIAELPKWEARMRLFCRESDLPV